MNLLKIYETLLGHYGKQHWWPADTPFEVIVGAILTQQASWTNVELAINNLKKSKKLTPKTIHNLSIKDLERLIKPSGFYKIKAKRLKNFTNFLFDKYNGSLKKLFSLSLIELRHELLSVNGIGKETADSIILYAAKKPTFVVDAYTIRIFNRFGLLKSNKYEEVKEFFENNLPKDVNLFNEYHALIVELGKNICKIKPKCLKCPINRWCKYAVNTYNSSFG